MNRVKRFLLAGSAGIALATAAQAADLPTAKPAVPAPPMTVGSCTSAQDFVMTACPLSWGGVTFYGTVDVGVGYQKFGAPLNSQYPTGLDYLIGKAGNPNLYSLAPNGLSQSNIGVKIKEEVAYGWSIVGQAEVGFDPYSLELANGPGSQWTNNLTKLQYQSANGARAARASCSIRRSLRASAT